jgi:hypothetical protein
MGGKMSSPATLAFQLATNPQTWEVLLDNGVGEGTELQLDFFYLAPSQGQAETLVRFLRDETDYDVEAVPNKKGRFSKTTWTVSGNTQPTTVSLPILNEWVSWMVAAGADHGQCQFDGWGAEIPWVGVEIR